MYKVISANPQLPKSINYRDKQSLCRQMNALNSEQTRSVSAQLFRDIMTGNTKGYPNNLRVQLNAFVTLLSDTKSEPFKTTLIGTIKQYCLSDGLTHFKESLRRPKAWSTEKILTYQQTLQLAFNCTPTFRVYLASGIVLWEIRKGNEVLKSNFKQNNREVYKKVWNDTRSHARTWRFPKSVLDRHVDLSQEQFVEFKNAGKRNGSTKITQIDPQNAINRSRRNRNQVYTNTHRVGQYKAPKKDAQRTQKWDVDTYRCLTLHRNSELEKKAYGAILNYDHIPQHDVLKKQLQHALNDVKTELQTLYDEQNDFEYDFNTELKDYDDLSNEIDEIDIKIDETETERDNLQIELDELEDLSESDINHYNVEDELEDQISELQDQIAELEGTLSELEEEKERFENAMEEAERIKDDIDYYEAREEKLKKQQKTVNENAYTIAIDRGLHTNGETYGAAATDEDCKDLSLPMLRDIKTELQTLDNHRLLSLEGIGAFRFLIKKNAVRHETAHSKTLDKLIMDYLEKYARLG